MGRTMWTDALIQSRIGDAVRSAGVERMPTARELRQLDQGNALACVIVRRGGFDAWADRLGLPRATHSSRFGWGWEEWFATAARERGHTVETRGGVKSPWDVLVSGRRVDVKVASGQKYEGATQWTWRIGKAVRDVDVYALIALRVNRPRLHLVPEPYIPATNATMRGPDSKYLRWLDRWELLEAA